MIPRAEYPGAGIEYDALLGEHEAGRVAMLGGMVAGGTQQVQLHVCGNEEEGVGNPAGQIAIRVKRIAAVGVS